MSGCVCDVTLDCIGQVIGGDPASIVMEFMENVDVAMSLDEMSVYSLRMCACGGLLLDVKRREMTDAEVMDGMMGLY